MLSTYFLKKTFCYLTELFEYEMLVILFAKNSFYLRKYQIIKITMNRRTKRKKGASIDKHFPRGACYMN